MEFEDNYTVEDLDIDNDNIKDEEVQCNKNDFKELLEENRSISNEKSNINNKIKNSENKDITHDECFSKCLINCFYHKYKFLFSKMVQNALLKINTHHKTNSACILFFCDFFNLDLFEKFDNYSDVSESLNKTNQQPSKENTEKSKSLDYENHRKNYKKKRKSKKKYYDKDYKMSDLRPDTHKSIKSKEKERIKRVHDNDEYKEKFDKKKQKLDESLHVDFLGESSKPSNVIKNINDKLSFYDSAMLHFQSIKNRTYNYPKTNKKKEDKNRKKKKHKKRKNKIK